MSCSGGHDVPTLHVACLCRNEMDVLAAPSSHGPAEAEDDDEVPALLDHIIIGCTESRSRHPTCQRKSRRAPHSRRRPPAAALATRPISGRARYLEIIAQDFLKGRSFTSRKSLNDRAAPHRLGRPSRDIAGHLPVLRDIKSPSRVRPTAPVPPDGHVLNGNPSQVSRTTARSLRFIEWSAYSVHLQG